MKRALPLLLLIPVFAFAQTGFEREWFPYRKLVEMTRMDKFHAIPAAQRDKLDMLVHVAPSDQRLDINTVQLTAVHAGGRTALPIDRSGNIHLALDPKWLAEDAKVMTNQPKDSKVGVGPGMNAIVPAGREWQYGALMGSVAQANGAIKQMAGAMSLFAPTVRSVILKFDGPAQVTIQSKGGAKQYATDAKHQIRLKPEPALLAENPAIMLSARPWEAELDTE